MKKTILIMILTLSAVLLMAQNPLGVKNTQVNAGLGFSSYGIPLYLGFDRGIHDDVTAGGEISISRYRHTKSGNTHDHSVISLSGNANYHFNHALNIPLTWDFYAGLNFGLFFYSESDVDEHTSSLGLGAQLGGRYFLTERTAINLEFSAGNVLSGGKIGITYKL